MTNYKTGLLKIIKADTKLELVNLQREFIRQYMSYALTADKYIKLDNKIDDRYTAIYWSEWNGNNIIDRHNGLHVGVAYLFMVATKKLVWWIKIYKFKKNCVTLIIDPTPI